MKNSAIYIIKNNITQDIYVGSTNDFKKRVKTHLRALLKNKHHSIFLQRAFNKYGEKNFVFLLYLECEPDQRLELENRYIKELNPAYNISKNAIAPMDGRKHTEETKQKMSKSSRRISGKNHHGYGKKWTQELREKILTSRIGGKRTLETRKKMSDTAKRINSISRVDRDKIKKKIIDQFGNVYASLTEAAKKTGTSTQAICDNLKGRSISTRKGKIFKYV